MNHALARRLFGCCVASLLVGAAGAQAPAAEAPAVADRQAIMRLVAKRWLDTQTADGFLPYGFDFLTDRATDEPASQGYIVREVGAYYAWGHYYRYTKDARFEEPLRRGIAAFARHSLPIGKSRAQEWLEATRLLALPVGRSTLTSALGKLGLLYEPVGPGMVVSADGKYSGAWAGATAFALLAELTYWRASADTGYANLRSAWRTGLLALWIPGAGFREGPTSIEPSDYYNGEAWLALAVYADLVRSDEPLQDALAEIDRTLMRQYTERPSNTFHSWGAMAASQRWRTTRDPRFLGFLKQQAEIFLPRFERRPGREDSNNCAAMEGLAAALGVLAASGGGENDALAAQIRSVLAREAKKVPGLQVQPGQTRMLLGGDATLSATRLGQFGGAFLMGRFNPVTRVDAAQHCLSALLMIEELRLLEPEDAPHPQAPK